MNAEPLHVVLGAGALGRAVIRELYARGQRVRAVNRSGKSTFPASVEVIAADVGNVEQARRVCSGATVVYFCAQPPYHRWVNEFPGLLDAGIAGASSAGATLVMGDNLYMYGEVDGVIREDLPYNATTRKGRVRAQMAETLLNAHATGRVKAVIGRASDFFGPGVLFSIVGERVMVPAIRGKKVSLVGDPDQPHTYTYIGDFARALVILGHEERALGEVWHVPNPETVSTRAFVTMIAEEAGTDPTIDGMSRGMLWLGGIFLAAARETKEMLYEFEKPFLVDSSKFEQTFGQKATPLRDAIRETVEWFQMHKKGVNKEQ
jgi:nucleoside-diphosphate-sugar epimerase